MKLSPEIREIPENLSCFVNAPIKDIKKLTSKHLVSEAIKHVSLEIESAELGCLYLEMINELDYRPVAKKITLSQATFSLE